MAKRKTAKEILADSDEEWEDAMKVNARLIEQLG